MSIQQFLKKKVSDYQHLLQNPYHMHHKEIADDVTEVIFYVVSCMCDNRYTLKFEKNSRGRFKMSGGRFSLSNFSFSNKIFEIEWEADKGNWIEVKNMINSGTIKVEKVISR